MAHLAGRLAQFRPSPTLAVSALVRTLKAQGRDIIGLASGEPDFYTPEPIKDAGIAAIRNNRTRYTGVDGIPALKQAVSEKFKRDNGLDYGPAQIVVSNGTKPILHAALLAMADPGDEVIVPAPYWGSHPDIARIVGAVPVTVPCPAANGFRLQSADLAAAITPRTRVLILNSPNNPTGAVYGIEDLRGIIAVLKAHPDIWVLTDEIYEHIRFEGRTVTSLAALDAGIAERTVTVNGFSKGYAMTGWRLGFAGGPAAMMRAIANLLGQLIGSPNEIAQEAAVVALTGDQSFLESNAASYQARRDLAMGALQQMPGLACHQPEGAFYLFVDCSGTIGRKLPDGKIIETDEDFVRGAIEHAGVAVTPGGAFGMSPYFRLSFSVDIADLQRAMERLRRYCNQLT
ncbi:MAG: pyridoxal phosphate-dependent aminotransferase [Acetobacteraceae bacterium]